MWLLLLAIGSHKFIIALCIGQQLVTNRVNKCLVILYIATFSLTTILGAGAGQNIACLTITVISHVTGLAMLHSASSEEDAQSVGVTLMQGIATGSLLYVVFFEVIEKERAGRTSHSLQLVFTILGSATIIGLKVLEDVMSQGESGTGVREMTTLSPANMSNPMSQIVFDES